MNTYECLCGEQIIHTFPDHFLLDGPEGILGKLLKGELFYLTCPACGLVHKLEERAIISTVNGDFCVLFLPEEYREQVLAGTYTFEEKVNRLTVGYPELAEKVLLWREGLDDQVIEYLKFGFLLKMHKNVSLIFKEINQGRLEFFVEGFDPGKVAVTSIPVELYQNQLKKKAEFLSDPRLKQFLNPPHVSVRGLHWEKSE